MTTQDYRDKLTAGHIARAGPESAARFAAENPDARTNGRIVWAPNRAALANRPTLLLGSPTMHRVQLFALLQHPRLIDPPDRRCHGHPSNECVACDGTGEVECNLGHEHDCEDCDGQGGSKCDKCGNRDNPGDGPEPWSILVTRAVKIGRAIVDGALLLTACRCLGLESDRWIGVAVAGQLVTLSDGEQLCVIAALAPESYGLESALPVELERVAA